MLYIEYYVRRLLLYLCPRRLERNEVCVGRFEQPTIGTSRVLRGGRVESQINSCFCLLYFYLERRRLHESDRLTIDLSSSICFIGSGIGDHSRTIPIPFLINADVSSDQYLVLSDTSIPGMG